jgi:hypothetical protein
LARALTIAEAIAEALGEALELHPPKAARAETTAFLKSLRDDRHMFASILPALFFKG